MAALQGDPFRNWEEEIRQASLRGLEGILPPPSGWGSFLLVAVPDLFPAGTGLPWEMADDTAAAAEPEPAAQYPAAPPGPSSGTADAPPASAAELPEARLPEDLRAEIDEFLGRDRPTSASDDELRDFLKGGIDPNVNPEG